jgi:hypothetical protein
MLSQGHDPIDLAARNWVEEMTYIDRGLASVDANNVYELHYEHFLSRPHAELDKLLDFIGVADSTYERYSASVAALALKPENVTWMTAWTEEQQRRARSIQESMLTRAGYI